MAIEDAPRHDPDHNPGINNVEKPRRDGFLESWRRLQRAVEQNDDDDEETDTLLFATLQEKVSPPKKESRLRAALRRILPRPDKIESSDEEGVLSRHSPLEHQTEGRVSWLPGLESTPAVNSDEKSNTEKGDDNEPIASGVSAVDSQISSWFTRESIPTPDPSVVEQELVEDGQSASERNIDLNNAIPDGDVESVRTILQRRSNPAEAVNNPDPVDATQGGTQAVFLSGEGGGYQIGPNSLGTTVNNYEQNYYDRRGTSLNIFDVANYGLARRRDKKIHKASIRRDEELKKISERQRKELNRRIDEQQGNQKRIDERTSALERSHTSPEQSIIVENNTSIKQESNIQRVDKRINTTKSERADISSVENSTSIIPEIRFSGAEQPIVKAPDVALPSAEKIFHKVEQAAERNIPIESQYELRHENKGNDFYAPMANQERTVTRATTPQSGGYAGGTYQAPDISPILSPSTHRKAADQYKEVAGIGLVGVVVGIVIFAVIYVLTLR